MKKFSIGKQTKYKLEKTWAKKGQVSGVDAGFEFVGRARWMGKALFLESALRYVHTSEVVSYRKTKTGYTFKTINGSNYRLTKVGRFPKADKVATDLDGILPCE